MTYRASFAHRDHPHPCGEKLLRLLRGLCVAGSPPPMWGKVGESAQNLNPLRITPTHVGKSYVLRVVQPDSEDHPHPCGEKSAATAETEGDIGSPPPMWGKVDTTQNKLTAFRITPTHVGKSLSIKMKKATAWDHPHPCGEKSPGRLGIYHRIGSPPPMWGKAIVKQQPQGISRITPTHVGKSNLACKI